MQIRLALQHELAFGNGLRSQLAGRQPRYAQLAEPCVMTHSGEVRSSTTLRIFDTRSIQDFAGCDEMSRPSDKYPSNDDEAYLPGRCWMQSSPYSL
jgi:hypothetical protein